MCTRYPIINRVSELKVHIELTRFVQPEKIEINANERAVNEKSQYCFFVCTTFDSFLNDFYFCFHSMVYSFSPVASSKPSHWTMNPSSEFKASLIDSFEALFVLLFRYLFLISLRIVFPLKLHYFFTNQVILLLQRLFCQIIYQIESTLSIGHNFLSAA